jgi:hypothetical protein
MDMTHEAALTDLIRDVIEQGSAKVETRLLLRWFGRRNWGRAIWQSLHQRFQSELADRREEDEGWQLYVIPSASHVMSLICFSPEDAAKDDGWWRPIEKLI